jgi:hypothetical protein
MVKEYITRNTSTPETKEFWESAKRIAKQVKDWPDSRRAGINIKATKEQINPNQTCICIDGYCIGIIDNLFFVDSENKDVIKIDRVNLEYKDIREWVNCFKETDNEKK